MKLTRTEKIINAAIWCVMLLSVIGSWYVIYRAIF